MIDKNKVEKPVKYISKVILPQSEIVEENNGNVTLKPVKESSPGPGEITLEVSGDLESLLQYKSKEVSDS